MRLSKLFSVLFYYIKSSLLWVAANIILLVSTIAQVLFLLYEIIVPRGLRELVPILNMYRKYLIYVSNLFAEPKRKELIKLEQQIDELQMQEDKIHKAYPIQRGVGETYDHIVTFLFVVILPIFVWKRSIFDVVNPFVFAIFLSTAMGILSWTATFFGPIYALFHRVSMRLVKKGAYGWALFYQKLEDFFSLPYLASKSSFTVFDAPPIDAETFEDFKITIFRDLRRMKEKLTNIVASTSIPYTIEVKKTFQEFLSKHTDELDMIEIEDAISRAFALLIWKREKAFLPWRKERSLRVFAQKNNMDPREAKRAIKFVVNKLEDKFISRPFYISILLTGALKGVHNAEKEYNIKLEDREYNQLAFSLALGAQRYIVDRFKQEPITKQISKALSNFLFGFFAPYIELFLVLKDYGEHMANTTKKIFANNWSNKVKNYMKMRYNEVHGLFRNKLLDEDITNDEVAKEEAKAFMKSIIVALKVILKVVLALPFSIYYLGKTVYLILTSIFTKRAQKHVEKIKFEKKLVEEAMTAMYNEIYEKLILYTYYYV